MYNFGLFLPSCIIPYNTISFILSILYFTNSYLSALLPDTSISATEPCSPTWPPPCTPEAGSRCPSLMSISLFCSAIWWTSCCSWYHKNKCAIVSLYVIKFKKKDVEIKIEFKIKAAVDDGSRLADGWDSRSWMGNIWVSGKGMSGCVVSGKGYK